MMNTTSSEGHVTPATRRRIREEGSTAAVTHYVETRWPAIGGRKLAPLPERAFLDAGFSEAYQPGHVAYVYVAGSGDTLKAPDQPSGLHGLARRFALPLFKISATAAENALARIEDINLERYAGMYAAEAGSKSRVIWNSGPLALLTVIRNRVWSDIGSRSRIMSGNARSAALKAVSTSGRSRPSSAMSADPSMSKKNVVMR